MRKVYMRIAALIACLFALVTMSGVGPASAAVAYEEGHNTPVVISGAIDWKFSVVWETNYNASIPSTTEAAGLYLCQNGTVGTKKKATSARVTYKNGRTGAIVKRWTYNFGAGPTATCNTFNQFADPRGQFPDIALQDFPTFDVDFWSGADLTGTLLGTVRGYEYL